LSHGARKFERLLEAYRREAGREWSGVELERATGSVVTRSYVTNLRKGRIENPGLDKLAALARAMGFPLGAWFEEELSGEGRGVATGRPEGSRAGSSACSGLSRTRRRERPTRAPRSPA